MLLNYLKYGIWVYLIVIKLILRPYESLFSIWFILILFIVSSMISELFKVLFIVSSMINMDYPK